MRARWWAVAAAGVAGLLAADAREAAEARDVASPGAAAIEADPFERFCELRDADRATTPSHRCVACHDGAIGPVVQFQMGTDELGMSHPVEVDYGQARSQAWERYVPEAMLPADVPLVDGKVACTSCHDGASTERKHVIDPMRLCYACHRM